MSDKELRKWENKFRLWVKMHPKFKELHSFLHYQDNCEICVHKYTEEGGTPSLFHCPKHRLVTEDFVKLFPYEEGCENVYCVEWVKNV